MNRHISIFIFLLLIGGKSFSQCNEKTVWDQAWYSCERQPGPGNTDDLTHWILFDFGQVYPLAETHVWNVNKEGELAKGFRQVRVEFSEDSLAWFTLGAFEFEQGTGELGYEGFTGPDFQGSRARYVLLSALSNWGDANCAGLTEVKFNLSDTELPTPVSSELLMGNVILYPNPAAEQITISYSSTRRSTWTVSLYNLLGQKIDSKRYNLNIGNNRLEFPLQALTGGTYWIRVTDPEGIQLYGQRVLVRP
ncbi:MAG: T9SS type A sorting domain-containing protein [Bacteroidota bacterium]